MTTDRRHADALSAALSGGTELARSPVGLAAWIKLARPKQWVKGLFVLLGPVYGQKLGEWKYIVAGLLAFVAFGLISSACYVINDLRDREADSAHPRKRHRPLASGAIKPGPAVVFAALLALLAFVCAGGVWAVGEQVGPAWWSAAGPLLLGVLLVYAASTLAYSFKLKHVVIVDVMILSLGFVLRVLAGCAAVMAVPSTYLLNVTFFVAMFLAFGKRLGERRSGPESFVAVRSVQAAYSDGLLRMLVVVTGVGALITYAGYVQYRGPSFHFGFNLLWLTMLPATYALARSMLLLETGRYDDPTELAGSDRPFQLAAVVFAGLTVVLLVWFAPVAGVSVPIP